VAVSGECGDEPSGFGATELVISTMCVFIAVNSLGIVSTSAIYYCCCGLNLPLPLLTPFRSFLNYSVLEFN
jgi:hypothetical protein